MEKVKEKSKIFNKDKHESNIQLISVTLFVLNFDISGNEDKDKQLENIQFISVTLWC